MAEHVLRLVATDLDGTLLRSDGTVSSATVSTLADLEDAGIVVVLVTARPVRWVRELAPIVHGHGTVICANGAVVYDAHADRILSTSVLPSRVARTIVADVRRVVPGARFAREAVTGFGREPDYPERHPTPAGSPIGPIDSLLGDDTVKLLVRDPSASSMDLAERVTQVVGGRATTTSSDTSGIVEISAAGVTKALALRRFCSERSIASTEVIAFGDMLNDIPMLRWAGVSVAVSNAHPDVRAIADRIAPSNDDDGVAEVMRALLRSSS